MYAPGRVPAGCGEFHRFPREPSEGCLAAGRQASPRVFSPSFTPPCLFLDTPLPAPLHTHLPGQPATALAAAATVARETATPHAASIPPPSGPPPSPACTATTPWLNPNRWSGPVVAVAGVNWHEASRSCSSNGTRTAAGLSRPRPCTG